jgi:2-polyprenyl-3-methyl-5-hydroxy-6-metoxy-1,4-benzoquinol methylase
MDKILLLGAGNAKRLPVRFRPTDPDEQIISLDIDPNSKPDIIHDLNVLPYPFQDNEFDQIHAYEVMEHLGQQGDWKFFFKQFEELARILKPECGLVICSPKCTSVWLWGDPGHTRYIGPEQMTFLDQGNYVLQIGKTTMTDYRHFYKADWSLHTLDTQSYPESNIMLLVNHKKEI